MNASAQASASATASRIVLPPLLPISDARTCRDNTSEYSFHDYAMRQDALGSTSHRFSPAVTDSSSQQILYRHVVGLPASSRHLASLTACDVSSCQQATAPAASLLNVSRVLAHTASSASANFDSSLAASELQPLEPAFPNRHRIPINTFPPPPLPSPPQQLSCNVTLPPLRTERAIHPSTQHSPPASILRGHLTFPQPAQPRQPSPQYADESANRTDNQCSPTSAGNYQQSASVPIVHTARTEYKSQPATPSNLYQPRSRRPSRPLLAEERAGLPLAPVKQNSRPRPRPLLAEERAGLPLAPLSCHPVAAHQNRHLLLVEEQSQRRSFDHSRRPSPHCMSLSRHISSPKLVRIGKNNSSRPDAYRCGDQSSVESSKEQTRYQNAAIQPYFQHNYRSSQEARDSAMPLINVSTTSNSASASHLTKPSAISISPAFVSSLLLARDGQPLGSIAKSSSLPHPVSSENPSSKVAALASKERNDCALANTAGINGTLEERSTTSKTSDMPLPVTATPGIEKPKRRKPRKPRIIGTVPVPREQRVYVLCKQCNTRNHVRRLTCQSCSATKEDMRRVADESVQLDISLRRDSGSFVAHLE